jgi:LysM repeat protein
MLVRSMERKRRTSIAARILAPLAILVAVVAVWAVASGKVDKSTSDAQTTTTTKHKAKQPKHATVKVKAGDTVSAIAIRNHVSTHWILKLNPDLNPNALQTGEVVKLKH